MNSDKPCLADIPQEVYDELQLYKTCYEVLREWHSMLGSVANDRGYDELVSDTKRLLREVWKMQEQQRKAKA